MLLGTRRTVRHKGLVRRCELRSVRHAGYYEWRDLDNGELFLTSLKPEYVKNRKPLRWIDATTGEIVSAKVRAQIELLAEANGLPVRTVLKVVTS